MKLQDIQAFLLDMDGTVYLGACALPGAQDFIACLETRKIPFLFLTNNPTADAASYSEKLAAMGIAAGPERILTAGAATADYLKTSTKYRKAYVLGTPSFERELERAGIVLDATAPEVVVVSFDKTLTYEKLERACLLLREGLPYIATNPDKVCPTEYGYIPDCGAIAALIETATGRTPYFIGKPEPAFARMALHRLGTDAPCTAMVGDRLYTDIEMARRAGLAAILVLSGETGRADLEAAERQPDFVFESVQELHRALLDQAM